MNGLEVKLFELTVIFVSSFVMRGLLVLIGQSWVRTMAHTGTIFILPIITYVITNVISGNIALSLGMVGALSIVRFRNPVRSPLELSTYFGAITIGIAASVDIRWLVFLIGSMILIAVFLAVTNVLLKKFNGKSLFSASFTEGNSKETLELCSRKVLEFKTSDIELIYEAFDGVNYTQIYCSDSQTLLKQKISTLKNNEDLISYKLTR